MTLKDVLARIETDFVKKDLHKIQIFIKKRLCWPGRPNAAEDRTSGSGLRRFTPRNDILTE